jgi:hypothetical protein
MKKIILKESELIDLIGKLVKEEMKETKKGKKDSKGPQCMPENVIPLDEIVGQSDMYDNYGVGITKRSSGVNSMVDTLAMLNNIRLLKDIKDGGTHLAYELMNNLNRFRNKNYYDETTGNCNKAMDKIIELYKENEHGTELVKDIEKVLNLQTREDNLTPSPRAKEYLKQSIKLVKGL